MARTVLREQGVLVRYLFCLSCVLFCLMLSRVGDSASNATNATVLPPPPQPPTVTLLAPTSAQNATEQNATEALRIPILPEIPDDPVALELEERITIYKFILESIGFSLTELVIAPDRPHRIELTFTGRLNTTAEKIREFTDKYKEEEKLMGLLARIFTYSQRDLTSFAAHKIVIRLSTPPEIEIFYRKP